MLERQNFLKAVIAISFEIVLFIENCIELNVVDIVNYLGLDLYDFWKIINPFNKYDGLIPSVIKLHFSHIEAQIFTIVIWQVENNFRSSVVEFFNKNKLDFSDFKKKENVSVNEENKDKIEMLEFNNQSLFVFQ